MIGDSFSCGRIAPIPCEDSAGVVFNKVLKETYGSIMQKNLSCENISCVYFLTKKKVNTLIIRNGPILILNITPISHINVR